MRLPLTSACLLESRMHPPAADIEVVLYVVSSTLSRYRPPARH